MYEMPIERGKIREFARATHSDNPAFHGDQPLTPPTFLTTAMMAWEPDGETGISDLGFELARVLHGEEQYLFPGPPPRAGQTLTVTSRVGDRYEKRGRRGGIMRFATVVHQFHDAAGTLVAEQRTTVVETAAAPEVS